MNSSAALRFPFHFFLSSLLSRGSSEGAPWQSLPFFIAEDLVPIPISTESSSISHPHFLTLETLLLVSSLYLQTCQHLSGTKTLSTSYWTAYDLSLSPFILWPWQTVSWVCPILSWLQAFAHTVKPSFPILNAIYPRTFYNPAKQIGSHLPLFL